MSAAGRKPGRFDRWILVAGWLATAGAVATAWTAAWPGADPELRGGGIGLHLQLATVSALGMLLPHLWTAIYLLGLHRTAVAGVGRLAGRGELARGLPVAAVAVLAVVLLMGTGAASYSGRIGAWHRIVCWAALAVQVLALAWEGRLLAANTRRLAAHR